MSYLKINGTDFSSYVNGLEVNTVHNYNAQTNAAGDTVVDYINTKRSFKVGIIPLSSESMIALQNVISAFSVNLSFRNPNTGLLEENVACVIPKNGVSYYTIQADKVSFEKFSITFEEL